jgi:hypothetical protein
VLVGQGRYRLKIAAEENPYLAPLSVLFTNKKFPNFHRVAGKHRHWLFPLK